MFKVQTTILSWRTVQIKMTGWILPVTASCQTLPHLPELTPLHPSDFNYQEHIPHYFHSGLTDCSALSDNFAPTPGHMHSLIPRIYFECSHNQLIH